MWMPASRTASSWRRRRRSREALAIYEAALEYPENLEVGRARRSPRTAQIQYLIGTAHEALGDAASAKAAFEKAAAGTGPRRSEADYFHALALQKLGRADEAKPIFERLVKAGEEQLAKAKAADYFAKFGEKTERACAPGQRALPDRPGAAWLG